MATTPVRHLEPLGPVIPEERFNPGVHIESGRDVRLEDVVARSHVELRVLRLDNVLETRLEEMPIAGAAVYPVQVERASRPLKASGSGGVDSCQEDIEQAFPALRCA